MITSTGKALRVQLPQTDTGQAADREEDRPHEYEQPILTDHQLKKIERENIIRALEAADGKVSGPDGAAALLGIKPSTLSSRIKSMKIRWVIR